MNLQLKEIIQYLEEIAPLPLQEPYDNSGLICGNAEWMIDSAIISLDATEAVIDEAIRTKANLVISHHPIIFKGLKTIQGTHYVERAIIKAIKNDIALYSIHTNLDNVLSNGVNQQIARRIGLKNYRILLPKSISSPETGAGLIGEFENPIEISSFLELIKSRFHSPVLKHTELLKTSVRKLALCGGSGSFLTSAAIREGADVYLSADFKYHEFFEANNQIVLIDMGHYESEQYTTELLFELISEKYPNFAAHCTKTVTNPVQYF
ncbi:MAG: Nif3-like dinuclear metal center hexameric protein [Saprospiraceae bacterium]|nr:Nif3-like dinuclear metal center hexameric protein [Saprospiraceae bacterium]